MSFLTLVWQLIEEKENSDFKPVVGLERDGHFQTISAQDTLVLPWEQ